MKQWSDALMITSSVNYAFYRRRILALHNTGLSVKVIGFQSNLGYKPLELPVEVVSIGSIHIGKYLKRIWTYLGSVLKIRKASKGSGLLYVFGFDMLLLTTISQLFLKRKPIVYEIHDIRDLLLSSGIKGRVFRFLEKTLVNRCSLLVLTSDSYRRNYYEKMLGIKKVLSFIIENKLIAEDIHSDVSPLPKKNDSLTIGYFGALRCHASWSVLRRLAREGDGKFKIYLRGIPIGLEGFEEECRTTPNLEYGGPYRDPDELSEIYQQVDLIWAAGFQQKKSFRWSRTCRFYNACCFKRPLIVQTDTDDGDVVDRLNIGLLIDLNKIENSLQKVKEITAAQIQTWFSNLEELPVTIYQYTDEHAQLSDICKKLTIKG